MNRNYVAYAYVYVYVSYKNEILKKREDVGKRLGGYWEEVGRTATNRRNAMRRAEANAKWGALVFVICICGAGRGAHSQRTHLFRNPGDKEFRQAAIQGNGSLVPLGP